MTELNVKYPATHEPPQPSGPGKIIHTYLDLTPHQGEEIYDRYVHAETEAEKDLILRDMPLATATFYELPEGEEFFDMIDHPKDKNGFGLWNNVWVMSAQDIGSIEALRGDEYDVQLGDDLVRLTPDKFKHIGDMRDNEVLTLDRLATAERLVP